MTQNLWLSLFTKIKNELNDKVNKITGKGLSTEDYTTAEKTKLAGLSNYDDTQIIEALDGKADVNHTHSQYLTEHQDISGKVDKVTGKGLSTNDYTTEEKNKLAGLSNYDDTQILSALDGKADVEDIPTKMSELENDNYYVSSYTVHNFEQPILTENGTMGGDSFAVSDDSLNPAIYYYFDKYDGVSTGKSTRGGYKCVHSFEIYNPTAIKITKLTALGDDDNFEGTKAESVYVKGSNDRTNWTNIEFSGMLDSTGLILDNAEEYKYYKFKVQGYYSIAHIYITATYTTQDTIPKKISDLVNDSGFLTSHQDISGKVDKVTGKGLSTEDYTTEEKTKLAGLSNYDDTEILSALDGKADVNHTHSQYLTEHQDISGKVDKVTGKGLSTEDYTTEEKNKLAGLSNYDDTQIIEALDGKADVNHTHSQYLTEHQDISGKVDKVTGKGLSTEDYTTEEKTKLAGLSNYDDTEILSALDGKADVNHTHNQYLTEHQDISGKVDKVTGKGLSTNDFTDSYKNKLDNLEGNISIPTKLSELENDNYYVSSYTVHNFEQPVLTENGTMGGDSFAVYTDKYDRIAYKYFDEEDNLHRTAPQTNDCVVTLTFYNPIPLNVTNIAALGDDDTWEGTKGENSYLKGSNDGETWTDISYSGILDSTGVTLTNTQYYKYYKFKLQSYYTVHQINITATYRTQDTIPKKTSDLTNDSGFLTSHQDISGKVDKVTGKGLSTEDYTTEEKTKLAGLSNYDDTEILSALDGKADVNHTHSQYLTEHQDISGKVDKVTGKGLSTNDFTDSYKNKLDNLEENISIPTDNSELTNGAGYITGINRTDVINALSYTPYNSTNPAGYTTNAGTITGIKMNDVTVGTSGLVDLGDVMTIQGNIGDWTTIDYLSFGLYYFENVSNSQLPVTTNASGFLIAYSYYGQICIVNNKMYYRQKDPSLGRFGNWQVAITDSDLSVKQDKSNLVTSLSANSTDTQYPSAKCVYNLVGDIESALNTINSGV